MFCCLGRLLNLYERVLDDMCTFDNRILRLTVFSKVPDCQPFCVIIALLRSLKHVCLYIYPCIYNIYIERESICSIFMYLYFCDIFMCLKLHLVAFVLQNCSLRYLSKSASDASKSCKRCRKPQQRLRQISPERNHLFERYFTCWVI